MRQSEGFFSRWQVNQGSEQWIYRPLPQAHKAVHFSKKQRMRRHGDVSLWGMSNIGNYAKNPLKRQATPDFSSRAKVIAKRSTECFMLSTIAT
jgi:hypothetical protein